ncbi:hypothetical protein BVRB_3g062160 [Beta vulgaris subsp. vulgaris]|nr:hypothetical protein BVRB_3g062160 [Beta vulgaris subsp. vulgaris]
MDNNYSYRKKPKEKNFNGDSRQRSQNNRKSSSSNGGRQQSALSLEKKFCLAVGGVSWQKVLDTQKYMFQDEKVLHWKDSAVEEAFWNAKNRFWAKMLGHPCDIELPDPDIFIDQIDWECEVDVELISDLEKRDDSGEIDQKNCGVVVGIPVVPEQYAFTSTGWGDAEEMPVVPEQYKLPSVKKGDAEEMAVVPEQYELPSTGWGDAEEGDPQSKNTERHDSDGYDRWGDNGVNHGEVPVVTGQHKLPSTGWGYAEYEDPKLEIPGRHDGNGYDHWGDNKQRCSNNRWEDGYAYVNNAKFNHEENYSRHNGGSTWNYRNKQQLNHGYNKKADHYGGQNTSRFRVSRFHQNRNDQSSIDDYGSNNRGNFSNAQRPQSKWKPVSRQW